jgi:hypothetical protein
MNAHNITLLSITQPILIFHEYLQNDNKHFVIFAVKLVAG